MKSFRNWLLFLIVVLIWSISWPALKVGLGYVGPLDLVSHRFIFSAIALSPLLILLWRRVPKDARSLVKLFLLGVILAVSILATITGLAYEKSGLSAILTYTQPLFVFCMAVPLLKEEAKASRFLGIFIGFLGVIILSVKRIGLLESFTYPTFLLILGAFLWAVTVVYYKKLLNHVDPFVTNAFQLVVSTVLLSTLNVAFGGFFFPLSGAYLLIIMFVSLAGFGLAASIWMFLLREEEATVLSFSSLIIPMVALFLGWLFLGERVDQRALLGAALILVGVYLVNKT